jgi:hypothetical protein
MVFKSITTNNKIFDFLKRYNVGDYVNIKDKTFTGESKMFFQNK